MRESYRAQIEPGAVAANPCRRLRQSFPPLLIIGDYGCYLTLQAAMAPCRMLPTAVGTLTAQ